MDAEPVVTVVADHGTYEVLDIRHNTQVVTGIELAKPAHDGQSWRRYVRELCPGKYEVGWKTGPDASEAVAAPTDK